MDTKQKLERAKHLEKEIKAIDDFIEVIGLYSHSADTNFFFKSKTEKSFSLLGTRYYTVGTHRREITVPDSMRTSVIVEAEKLKEELQKELDAIFCSEEK